MRDETRCEIKTVQVAPDDILAKWTAFSGHVISGSGSSLSKLKTDYL